MTGRTFFLDLQDDDATGRDTNKGNSAPSRATTPETCIAQGPGFRVISYLIITGFCTGNGGLTSQEVKETCNNQCVDVLTVMLDNCFSSIKEWPPGRL